MEIKLKVPLRDRQGYIRGCGLSFCSEAFHEVVELPRGTRVCYLVLSKKPAGLHGYPITRPLIRQSDGKMDRTSNLHRINRHYIRYSSRIELAHLYDQGYRSLHVEYDV